MASVVSVLEDDYRCFSFLNFIYLFLAASGVHARTFSSCGKGELLFVAVCRLLIAVASLVEHRL